MSQNQAPPPYENPREPGRSPGGPPSPPPQVIYAMPPKQPGFIRSMLSGLLRTILTLVVTIVVVWLIAAALVVGLGQMGGHPIPTVYRDGAGAARITIIKLDDLIDGDAAEYVRGAVEYVLDSPNIEAVVFRVDSPGGGVTASDQIWRQIQRLMQNGVQVVASYGGVAASGGYYVSCHADVIFAEETSITGSIGVMLQAFTMEDLMRDLGVQPITMVASQSPDKDNGNTLFRTWDEDDYAAMQPMLDHAYDVFYNRVREGRKRIIEDEEKLRQIADGSVYTAPEALANGLIDQIGYLDDAIDHAIQLARLPKDVQIEKLERWDRWAPPFWMAHLEKLTGSKSAGEVSPDRVRFWMHELSRPQAMYLRR